MSHCVCAAKTIGEFRARRVRRSGVTFAVLALFAACDRGAGAISPGKTRTDTTGSVFHDKRVEDPYRWLEDGTSPEVQEWIRVQNNFTDSVLASYEGSEAIATRVAELAMTSPDRQSPSIVGTTLFFLRSAPPAPQPVLVEQPWPSGRDRVLVDVNAAGGRIAITGYWPSPSGRLLAYATAADGNELATLRFVDTRSGVALPDSLPYAGGGTSAPAVAWDADERGISFARFPVPAAGQSVEEYDVSIFHYRLGAAGGATPELGQGFSRIAGWALLTSGSGRETAALVYTGDGSFADVFVRSAGTWRHVLRPDAGVTTGSYAGERLLLIATSGTPRGRVVRVEQGGSVVEILPQTDWAIQRIDAIAGGVLLIRTHGMDSRIEHFEVSGDSANLVRVVNLPDSGIAVGSIASSAASSDALITYSGWTIPTRWVRYDGRSGAVRPVFGVTAPGDYSNVVVHRFDAVSRDGTKVPVAVVAMAGRRQDGTAPTILTGYGGFRNAYGPRFVGTSLAWLERGGILAYADIRGGSSFGEGWHQGGMKTTKQHSFDDFQAAADELVRQKWTAPARLGITGGSNGGLLVGAAMTQHPESYGAVVSFVGIYDMLRHETFPNGAYNTAEYGATSDSAEFRALLAYSPLHHVKAGIAYPPILMETGLNDPRVASWQSRKFTAALQAASSRGPVLLLTRSDAGHGIGAPFSQRVGNAAMALSFFAHTLGLPVEPSGR
ncbi:MAG: Prolyl endopeptidase [Gemmatimonadaceae bacterium]|nr:Prolyl endopeptidase [Gemmatimonadaceae bacterium]